MLTDTFNYIKGTILIRFHEVIQQEWGQQITHIYMFRNLYISLRLNECTQYTPHILLIKVSFESKGYLM